MQHSHRFFENRKCEYFPCHTGLEAFNCLFCYCPLYYRKNCPGTPEYVRTRQGELKLCDRCTFPHKPENYDRMIRLLSNGQETTYDTTVKG